MLVLSVLLRFVANTYNQIGMHGYKFSSIKPKNTIYIHKISYPPMVLSSRQTYDLYRTFVA